MIKHLATVLRAVIGSSLENPFSGCLSFPQVDEPLVVSLHLSKDTAMLSVQGISKGIA